MTNAPLYRHGDGWPTHDDTLDVSSEWPTTPLVTRQEAIDVAVVAGWVAVLALAARTVAHLARRRPW